MVGGRSRRAEGEVRACPGTRCPSPRGVTASSCVWPRSSVRADVPCQGRRVATTWVVAGARLPSHVRGTSMSDPRREPLKFAYWVPNVSGGLVTSTIEQRTDWGFEYNRELAQTAENSGFDYALSQVRYMASYGADHQHESTSFSLALLLATERLK